MKIRLHGTDIDPTTVQQVRRIGHHIAQIELHTDEMLSVICGVRVPGADTGGLISYDGSFDELKACIDLHKRKERNGIFGWLKK